MGQKYKKTKLFLMVLCILHVCGAKTSFTSEKLAPSLMQVEQRLKEKTKTGPSEPNSLTYLRAIGDKPARSVSPRQMKAKRTLTLEECLQLGFINSNEIKQTRQEILAVGGSKLVNNSRFLPAIEPISQYEHFRNFGSGNVTDDTHNISAKISRWILEYGKDHPLDLTLRVEQRDALFNYEDKIASIFSQIREAFSFIKLKEQQIATRQQFLDQFQRQYEVKPQQDVCIRADLYNEGTLTLFNIIPEILPPLGLGSPGGT